MTGGRPSESRFRSEPLCSQLSDHSELEAGEAGTVTHQGAIRFPTPQAPTACRLLASPAKGLGTQRSAPRTPPPSALHTSAPRCTLLPSWRGSSTRLDTQPSRDPRPTSGGTSAQPGARRAQQSRSATNWSSGPAYTAAPSSGSDLPGKQTCRFPTSAPQRRVLLSGDRINGLVTRHHSSVFPENSARNGAIAGRCDDSRSSAGRSAVTIPRSCLGGAQ